MDLVRAHISFSGLAGSVQVRFPKFLLFLISAIRRVVQFSLLILVINLLGYLTYDHFLKTAREQRNRLYTRLQTLSLKVDSIDVKVSKSYKNEDLLYAKFGLAAPDTNVREMGFGGPTLPDSILTWSAMPIKKLKTNVSDRFRSIEAKIDRSHNSYLNLQLYVERLHGSLQHVPSVWPVTGFLSSHFGLRTHPVTGEVGKMHQGIDITAPKWTAIRAPANGRVEKVSDSETMGRYVAIDHGNGMTTRYGHMEKPFVKEGQIVSRFDVIGYVGNTGRTTGHHLHYEVWINGEAVNPVNYVLPDQYSVE